MKELLRIQSNSYHFHLDLDVCITLSRVIFVSLAPFKICWHLTDKIYLEHNVWRPQLEGSRKSLTLGYEMQPSTVTLTLKHAWHLQPYFSDVDGKKCSYKVITHLISSLQRFSLLFSSYLEFCIFEGPTNTFSFLSCSRKDISLRKEKIPIFCHYYYMRVVKGWM